MSYLLSSDNEFPAYQKVWITRIFPESRQIELYFPRNKLSYKIVPFPSKLDTILQHRWEESKVSINRKDVDDTIWEINLFQEIEIKVQIIPQLVSFQKIKVTIIDPSIPVFLE